MTSKSVTFGVSMPLSGPSAAVCKPQLDGTKAWIDHINSTGGVNGRQIKLDVRDDAYQAPTALKNARAFDAEGVFGIFNGCGTIQPPAIQTVAEPKKIPYLFPNASVDLSGAANAFTLLPGYDLQMGSLTREIMKSNGPGSVYIIEQQIPGSAKTTKAIEDAAKASGGSVAGHSDTTGGQADLTPVILQIKAAHPDFVAMADGVDAGRLVQQMEKQDAMPNKILYSFSGALQNVQAAAVSASTLERYVSATPIVAPDNPGAKDCEDVLAAGSATLAASDYGRFSCASAQVLVEALKRTGQDLTRTAFVEELHSWSDVSASKMLPPLTFSGDRQLGLDSMFLVSIRDGKIVQIGTLPLS